MTADQPSLFPFVSARPLPEGFRCCSDASTAENESRLLAEIPDLPFKEFQLQGCQGTRSVVSFDWRYDFSEHKVLHSDPIPKFWREISSKVQTACSFVLRDLQQVARQDSFGWP